MSVYFSNLKNKRSVLLKSAIKLKAKRRFFTKSKLSVFDFVIRELSISGFQYGHHVSQWNQPYIPSYLFLYFSLSHLIFNLSISFLFLRRAVLVIRQLFGRGARLLCAEGHHFSLVNRLGSALFQDHFVNGFLPSNWRGGTLTNWSRLVKRNLKQLKKLKILSTPTQEYVYSLRRFKFLPNVFFLFSSTTAPMAVLEANRLSIPTAGVVDSDACAPSITYPVFGNDNSSQSLYYLLFLIASAKVSGRFRRFKKLGRLVKRYLFRQFCCQRADRLRRGFLSLLSFYLNKLHRLAKLFLDGAFVHKRTTFKILEIRNKAYQVSLQLRKYGVFENVQILRNLRRITQYIKLLFGTEHFGLNNLTKRASYGRKSQQFQKISVVNKNARSYRRRLIKLSKRRRPLNFLFKGLTRGFRKALASVAALSRKIKYSVMRGNKKFRRFFKKRNTRNKQ